MVPGPGIGGVWSKTRHRLLGAALTVVCALAVLVLPAAARADIVYSTGNGAAIDVAHDDGSDPVQVLGVSQVPTMTSLGSPTVEVSGGQPSLYFTGTTTALDSIAVGECGFYPYYYPCDTFYDGGEATGIYRYAAGTLTRLSGPPTGCQCTTQSDEPEASADGSHFFYDQWGCAGEVSAGTFQCAGDIHQAGLGGSPDTAYEAACNGEFAQHASPDPANPSRIAFDGCPSSGADLEVAGASGAGDVVLAADATASDDVTYNNPSWSPDGATVVAYQGGADTSHNPGLYLYPAGGGAAALVLNAPLDPSGSGTTKIPYVFDDPRYIGAGTIAFSTDGNEYTVPASCRGCTFPTDAHLLESGASDASWTSAAVDTATPFTPSAPSGPSGPTGPAGSSPAAIKTVSLAQSHVKARKGFTLILKLARTGTADVVVLEKTHRRKKVVWSRLGLVSLKVGTTARHFTIKRVGGHALKAGSYRVEVYTVAGKQHSKVKTLTLTLTR